MKFSLYLIVFLALIFAVSTQNHHHDENTHHQPRCGRHEEFKTCGSNCQEHCPIRNPISGEMETGLEGPCNRACHRGCFCPVGLVRDLTRGGECVRRPDCPPIAIPQNQNQNQELEHPSNGEEPVGRQCARNEVYRSCGPSCPEQCPQGGLGLLTFGIKLLCNLRCVEGCFCAPGLVRDSMQNNACVERNQCRSP